MNRWHATSHCFRISSGARCENPERHDSAPWRDPRRERETCDNVIQCPYCPCTSSLPCKNLTGHEISLQASFKMCEEIAYWHLLTVNVSRSSLGLTILLLFSSFRPGEIYVEGLLLLLIPFARQKNTSSKINWTNPNKSWTMWTFGGAVEHWV